MSSYPDIVADETQKADCVIIICDNRERSRTVDPVIEAITATHITPSIGRQKVFFLYKTSLDRREENDIKGLPKGFSLSYGTNLPDGDFVIITGKKPGPDSETGEWEFTLKEVIERKSWNDWVSCVTGSRIADFNRQIASLNNPIINGKVYKSLVLTDCPTAFDEFSREYDAFVTKQQKLIREFGYEFKMTFNEYGMIALIRSFINWHLEGYFNKAAPKVGVKPEVLALLGREKVKKPLDVLQVTLASFTGIGEMMAMSIAAEFKTVQTLVNYFKLNGSNALSDFLINKRRLGDRSKIIYEGLMEPGADPVFVDQDHFYKVTLGDKGNKKRKRTDGESKKKGKEKEKEIEKESDDEFAIRTW